MRESDGYTVKQYDYGKYEVRDTSTRKVWYIVLDEYKQKLDYEDYELRLDYMKALIELLPKELPYSIREYIVLGV